MKYIVVTFIAMAICACSIPKFNYIGADFAPYVKEFDTLYAARYGGQMADKIQIDFGDQYRANDAGFCYNDGYNKIIIISKSEWNSYCDLQRRALIFHELLHCENGRVHVETVYSYMYPNILPCKFYEDNKAQLDAEMFK